MHLSICIGVIYVAARVAKGLTSVTFFVKEINNITAIFTLNRDLSTLVNSSEIFRLLDTTSYVELHPMSANFLSVMLIRL